MPACALRNLFFVFASALTFSAASSGGLAAETLTDQTLRIEALIADADMAGALAAADAIYGQIWDSTADIGFTEAVLVAEPASGFGVYNPRIDDKYAAGDPVILNVQPFGFGYGNLQEGLFSVGFIVDLKIVNQSGEILADVPAITELNQVARAKLREFQANITYNLTGIAPGRYVLQTTLRDKNSGKTGGFETEIEITE